MGTVSVVVGAVTSSTARVITAVDGASVRVAVSLDSALSSPQYVGPVTVASSGVTAVDIDGLLPNTQYWYAVEDEGTLDTSVTGKFRTHVPVGTPWSYTIATIGDAGAAPEYPGSGTELVPNRISNHPAFDSVRNAGPLMVAHLGDLHYYDLGTGNHGVVGGASVSNVRQAYTDILAQSRQHQLYRDVPWAYMWDNHDYGFVGAYADGAFPDKANVAQVYRERVPHYPTPEPNGSPYQSWQIGRVLYILNDTRYSRDDGLITDGPSKTMLGAAQKAWMFNLLETTTAEALVWLMPTPWIHGDANPQHWGAFATERAEIIEFLATTTVPASGGARTWAESMVQVTADIHALGLCSAANNPYGGFPVMLTAAIDATESPGGALYDVGYQAGRNQWGTVSVTDSGSQITLTLTGWVGDDQWGSQDLVISTAGPVPTPIPGPAAVAVPTIRSAIQWQGFHRTTGKLLADLPDITGAGERQLSDYVTASDVRIPLTRGGPGHIPIPIIESCTDGRTGSLVAVVNEVPLWMGLTGKRLGGSDSTMRVTAATPESYVLKRRVKDRSFTNVDRAVVAQVLIEDAQDWVDVGSGLGFEFDVELTGDLVTREYKATDETTVYDALQALCAEGLEWEVYFDWADATKTRIVKIFRIRRHIGRVTGTPSAMFQTGGAGSVVSYTLEESWTEGDWANVIRAIGPGQGDDQPRSEPAIDVAQLANGVPIIESVISPGNNITDVADLQAHADAELQRVKDGLTLLSIEAQLNAYPRLGFDVQLGDQVSVKLTGPRHPDTPFEGTRRVAGWVLHTQRGTWTPRLIDDPTLGVS